MLMIETSERYIFPTFIYESIDKEFSYQKELIDSCYSLATIYPLLARPRSNVNGWQSPMFNYNNDPLFFKSNIFKSIWNQFTQTSKYIDLKDEYCFSLKEIWVNINYPGSYNLSHTHPLSSISGVFYIKVPENSGGIVFQNLFETNAAIPAFSKNKELSITEKIKPEEGKMVLFNSYLPHYVEQNHSDDDRISMSFNVGISIKESFNAKQRKIKHIFNH
jgi:uncharacterized protein (TIGR02466 family)